MLTNGAVDITAQQARIADGACERWGQAPGGLPVSGRIDPTASPIRMDKALCDESSRTTVFVNLLMVWLGEQDLHGFH